MHLNLRAPNDSTKASSEIGMFLTARGFSNLGKDEKMLELLAWSSAKHGEDNSEQIRRINRETHFRNDSEEIDVTLVDYSDPITKRRYANYQSTGVKLTDTPALEINIYHFRPGGFGPKAHTLHNELKSFLTAKYGESIITIFKAPATNQPEYYKTTIVNLLASGVWWVAVFTVSLLLFGSVSRKLLKMTKLGVGSKRAVFTVVNSLLVTPLPFPAGFILTIILPSVLALPSIGTDYFTRIQSFAVPSFCVSLILCATISVFLFSANAKQDI
jgi:hypothetical protein